MEISTLYNTLSRSKQMSNDLRTNLGYIIMIDYYLRDGVVVRASASQSVDLEFISHVESYQKTFKNGIHNFPAWRSEK